MHTTTKSILLFSTLMLSTLASAQYNSDNLKLNVGQKVTEQFNCDRLKLFPIHANDVFRQAHKQVGSSVPMNRALQDGRLVITEMEGGGTVNTLKAINTSRDTIYLMQGEVVTGGKQDRMLAQDVLIPPGAKVDIGAFCVEHGRWQESSTGQRFNGTAGVVPQEVRKEAALRKDQSGVWEKVAKSVQKHDVQSSSGSYADVTRNKEFAKMKDAYREKLIRLPRTSNDIVGVVAVSGDRVVGCDVFATAEMFAQAYPQLIDAYIAEALTNGATVTMSEAALQRYFQDLFANESELDEKTRENGYKFKQEGKTYRLSFF